MTIDDPDLDTTLDEEGGPDVPRTGRSRSMRNILRRAREDLGMSQVDLAEKLVHNGKPLAPSTVSSWENFTRHPAIDMMAMWARAVGKRLVVELDDADSPRVSVLVEPGNVDLVRAVDLLGDEERGAIRSVVNAMRDGRLPPRIARTIADLHPDDMEIIARMIEMFGARRGG